MFREWILSRHYILDSVSKEHEANGPHSSRAFSEAWRVNTKHGHQTCQFVTQMAWEGWREYRLVISGKASGWSDTPRSRLSGSRQRKLLTDSWQVQETRWGLALIYMLSIGKQGLSFPSQSWNTYQIHKHNRRMDILLYRYIIICIDMCIIDPV